jgi:hypothetical protein
MLVDTTEYLAEPLGPAATASLRVCRPGESVLWAAYARAHYYDIPGLDEKGQPKKNLLVRGVGGVLGGLLDAAAGSDQGPDRPPPPDVVVFGPAPDCLAHRYLPPGPPRRQLWTLTPQRLALHVEAIAPEPGGSFLTKAARLGRDLAKIVTDNRQSFGANVEGEPVAPMVTEPVRDIPRSEIAGLTPALRGKIPVLRLSLVDGSGLDFLVAMTDREEVEYAAALANGHPPRRGAVVEWADKSARGTAKRARDLTATVWPDRLVLAASTNYGHVGVLLAGEQRLPHTPLGPVPELAAGPLRWPQPAATTTAENWTEDPVVGFFAQATDPAQDAVRFADLLAHTRGTARLMLTDQRVALLAAGELVRNPAPLVSVLEMPRPRLARWGAELLGRAIPPRPVLRLDFTDGSALWLRDAPAARQAAN